MTNPTEKIKEIEEEAKRLSKIKKPSKSDIEYHGRLLTKLQVYKEWEAREAKILEMLKSNKTKEEIIKEIDKSNDEM